MLAHSLSVAQSFLKPSVIIPNPPGPVKGRAGDFRGIRDDLTRIACGVSIMSHMSIPVTII